MNKLSALFILLFLSASASAHPYGEALKHFTVGFASYNSVVTVEDPDDNTEDYEIYGFAASVGYAISDQFALRATFFSQEEDDSEFDSSGYDLLVHLGINMASPGFKAYIGGGYFSDEWELDSYSRSFDGLQLNGGIGYNWESIALEFIIGIRDASEYEDFINEKALQEYSAAAASGSLMLSARF